MSNEDVKKGDVIQINPEHEWGGCLGIVEKVKSWGIQFLVTIPKQGSTYNRLNFGQFKVIGPAAFLPIDPDMEDEE